MIRQYEQDVEQGAVLVIVHGDESDMMAAHRLLQTTSPEKLDEFARSEHEPPQQDPPQQEPPTAPA